MRRKPSALAVYIVESRGIGLSLFMVVPLLMAYEVAMLTLQAPLRNGAEMLVSQAFGQLPVGAVVLLRRIILALLVAAAFVWARRDPPRVARPQWILSEALLLALLLGPLVGGLVGGLGLSAEAVVAPGEHPAWLPFLLSIGAGLWEEIVFRLVLLGGLAVLLGRFTGMTRPGALAVSVVASALAFALYHHVGDLGEPFAPDRFAFRAVAGTILGILFAYRGLAIVVYMHVFYDVLCDLRALAA